MEKNREANMSDLMHAGLTGYLRRARMETGEQREDGALVLVIDGQYRVYCHPAPGRALVLARRGWRRCRRMRRRPTPCWSRPCGRPGCGWRRIPRRWC